MTNVSTVLGTPLEDANTFLTTLAPTRPEVGSVPYPVLSKLHHTIHVAEFGAVGDGVTDNTAAIQAAIDAAAAAGVDVVFQPGKYRILGTLTIGNGSGRGKSTTANVRLIGATPPAMPPQFFTGFDSMNQKATYLQWGGPVGGTMVQIRGPLQGWGIENIFFDGADGETDFGGIAGRGLHVSSAMNGVCRHLTFRGCREAAIYSDTVAIPPGMSNADSLNNVYENIAIGMGWAGGVKGIVITGVNPAGSNTDYNEFRNVAIAMPTTLGVGESAYGVYFQSCDSNVFHNLHFFNGDPITSHAIVYDYTINPDWPAGNVIYGVDWGNLASPVLTAGTPSANARPNFIYAINQTNGGIIPRGVPNLVTESGVHKALYQVGMTTSSGSQVLLRPHRGGLYRITYYLLVTGGNAGGGSLTISFSWLDGRGLPVFTSPPVPNGPGNYTSGSVIARAADHAPTDIRWEVNINGFPGGATTQYSVSISAERLL